MLVLDKRIRNVYNLTRERCKTIARTETAATSNTATFSTYKAEGVKQKEWVGGTRESHAAVDGEVRAMGQSFSNGLLYPGDPSGPADEVINCTCTVSPVVE